MSTQTDGIASLPFVTDMIKLIKTKWTSNGGKVPNVRATWKVKAVGVGSRIYDEVIISIDSEDPRIFSLISGGTVGKFTYDWLHDMSITLDIRTTGTNETRVLQLVNEVVRILKKNVILSINNHDYIQVLPGNIVSLNEEYRNLYRYTVDVDAMRFNP